MADGSVEIDGKITTEGVEKGVKKIDQELKKIERTAEKTTKKTAVDFKKLDTVMQEASNTASGFANKISSAASSGGLDVGGAGGAGCGRGGAFHRQVAGRAFGCCRGRGGV